MRTLWTSEVVTFKGRLHTVEQAGLNPLPVQPPIPVWMRGRAERALARIARIGDGWFSLAPPDVAGHIAPRHSRGSAGAFLTRAA